MKKKLGTNLRSAVLYQAFRDELSDDLVVVEADGEGGARTSVVEGNFPLEFIVKHSKNFSSEKAAVNAAVQIAEDSAEPAKVLD